VSKEFWIVFALCMVVMGVLIGAVVYREVTLRNTLPEGSKVITTELVKSITWETPKGSRYITFYSRGYKVTLEMEKAD